MFTWPLSVYIVDMAPTALTIGIYERMDKLAEPSTLVRDRSCLYTEDSAHGGLGYHGTYSLGFWWGFSANFAFFRLLITRSHTTQQNVCLLFNRFARISTQNIEKKITSIDSSI